MVSFLYKCSLVILVELLFRSPAVASAIGDAVTAAKIKSSDPLEMKIDKALRLLNEERYFFPKEPVQLPSPFDNPYHLDSLRTPEEILSQKVGGSCGSSARPFAAILVGLGVRSTHVQIVESVVNSDLKMICPHQGRPRQSNPPAGAKGHSFVAVRFPDKKWKLINSIGGSRSYERADWYSPEELQQKMSLGPVPVPSEAFQRLPRKTYGKGLTVFQSWFLKDIPKHTFEQRFDLIASGRVGPEQDPGVRICRFTAPAY